MSGHSKWSTIKRKKGKADAARGKVCTKLIREITVAARSGGADPESNSALRNAIAAAKAANMPASNIDRAIKKGVGGGDGAYLEEVMYEAYAPGGVAVLIKALTDNRNRTTSEIRHIFTKHGSSLAEVGAVAYLFEQKGVITVDRSAVSEEKLIEVALEAGAEDVSELTKDAFEVVCSPKEFQAVNSALESAGIPVLSAEITQVPQTNIPLQEDQSRKILRLMEAIDDHDDVQKVYSNFDIPEELLQRIASEG
jgi:YebC/PmpR family DNA-binding regulatory protein